MNICIVGAGYVGLTTAAVLAELGHTVECVDRDEGRIDRLNVGIIPIYEPGLDALTQRNRRDGRLFFSADVSASMKKNDIVMIAVGTPSGEDGAADLVYVRSVLLTLANAMDRYKIVIMKSTVPPGTGAWAKRFLLERGVPSEWFDIVSNPEFLREGTAIYDTFHPDRIVIGSPSRAAAETVRSLYGGIEAEVLLTGIAEAELIKYGSNAFLATKLSFINELARVCDAFGADITKVAPGIGMDSRIGGKFLQAGIGYGGSCLPKDVSALIAASASRDQELTLLRAVERVNRTQLDVYASKLASVIGDIDSSKHVAVWGATFKENTDDIRHSQAIALMERLAAMSCKITAYDPLVSPAIEGVEWKDDAIGAAMGADALIVATGWGEFVEADWHAVKQALKGNVVLDGRNVLDQTKLAGAGLRHVGVGRP
ncbi:UDP-glucose dehydrogenase family protein [Paenibacillus soyae]|uniref:UDP-glucose 6-dehydrogenase n=1 Tax=Paenibacillus soyae TaxID=2969249 RepID=A0A9X2MUB3_9BACL|nr:UDP-glucose/GDP-mannose dehydrogenase family protein [Paenibacillus soyae]MCR2806447.1 UDP-glucose/GDP-mannose dehydrogenase family protein [Paenibacillus soyae]